MFYLFFFSSRRRHTSCALVTGVQTCALPIYIGGYRGLEFTDSFWGMTAVKNANDMLGAGFTTVRNVGSDNRNDIGLKQAIDAGYATGPRIVRSEERRVGKEGFSPGRFRWWPEH